MRIQKRRCDRGSGKSELPKQKTRVFERAKHKTTRCVPYKSENTVSSTIITFLDKTNLRKQTSVHLFMRSNYANCRRKNVPQKLILINSPNDQFKVCEYHLGTKAVRRQYPQIFKVKIYSGTDNFQTTKRQNFIREGLNTRQLSDNYMLYFTTFRQLY